MLKSLNAKAMVDRLQSFRPSKQAMLRRLKQGGIAVIALGGLCLIAPPLWDAISVSPQQRVEPLNRRIDDLDKQIKASPPPSTADLKEIATLEKGRIDSENTIRTSLFQAVGGLLVFITLWISWRTLQANEAKQVAERFSKAAEQLGDDNAHVRLSGIFMLEQVAKDAEEKYYWQVMEMLTSYVRERSPYPPKAAKSHSSFVQAAIELTQHSEPQSNEAIPPLPTDVQAVMTVLARREHSYGDRLERHPLDLHGADLRRLQLPLKTQLNQANLAGTNLQEASLEEVNLQEANLEEANLQRAYLWGANLQEAYLRKANLQGARLENAKLQKAGLVGAQLQQVNFEFAELEGAFLGGAELEGAFLFGADLQGADLRLAKLQGANLQKAKLQGARLCRAELQNVKFDDANLQGANLEFANLYGAFGLNLKQVQESIFYESAILPDYLQSESPQAEVARSTNQATESVQPEGEMKATQLEETPLAPPES